MSIGLHNLKRFPGSVRKRKDIGRGLGSGHGAYSTRGVKGQRARTGGSKGIHKRSIKLLYAQVPKLSDFTIRHPKFEVVNLDDLETHFAAGATVDRRELVRAGFAEKSSWGVKVLAQGKLTKALTVVADAYSAAAKAAIEAAGGKALTRQEQAKAKAPVASVPKTPKKGSPRK